MHVEKERLENKRGDVLAAARTIARASGYWSITAAAVASLAGVSTTTIFYYFPSIERLKDTVISAAIGDDDPVILAQALSAGRLGVGDLGSKGKQKVIDYLRLTPSPLTPPSPPFPPDGSL